MPKKTPKPRQIKIKVGDFFEDCGYHPVLCTDAHYDKKNKYESAIVGISLIDGSSPRQCSIAYCSPRRISFKEAIDIKENGPSKKKKKHFQSLIPAWKKEKDKWWK